MKNIRLPLTALLAPLGLGVLLHADGARATLALDPTFDTDGIAQVDIAAGADAARDIAVQIDGALVLGGRSRQTVGANTIDYVTLTRLIGTTGAVDSSFGAGGTVTFLPGLSAANGGGGDGRALAIQPLDQKVVVAGTWDANQGAGSQVFVARFDTTGVLDAGFGTGGVVLLTPAGVTNPAANAIALRSDGSIVVVGSGTATGTAGVGFVIVLDSTGTLAPGYTPAVVPNPLSAPGGADFGFNAVAVLTGDRILAAGGGGDASLAQFTSTGAPDTSFDGDGIATFNYLNFDDEEGTQSTFDVITALTVLGDGRLLIAGRWGENSTSTATNSFLGRVTSNGTLDDTFGSGGFAPLAISGNGEVPETLGVRPSGDIVLMGPLLTPTQVSPNGIAVNEFVGNFTTALVDLEVLGDGSVVAAGERTVTGANTAFGAVRLTATDLADGSDTVPDPFAFTTQTGLEPAISVTSNAVTITGIGIPAPITVGSGAEYSIGCTANFVSTAGTISNGQTVCVRAESRQEDLAVRFVQLFIGGVQGVFTLVTGDATPDAFTFVDQAGVVPNTLFISAPITLTGLTTRTNVAVTGIGGTFSVGCTGTFTAQTTKVDPGAQICVRNTSSASPGGTTLTVLRVGVGTIVSGTFTLTTTGDSTPDAFNFLDQTNVDKSTVITSTSVTLTGFTSNTAISVTGGEYSTGCTAVFTSAAGTVAPNSTVCVRHTSSAVGGTNTNTTLTVGAGPGLTAVSDTFTSTTAGTPDTTPEPFSFPDQTNVPLATVITSGAITIAGFDTNATISITGGTYSVNCGSQFTANSGTLAPNTRVCLRHTSASTGSATTDTTLTVGGVSDTFTSTTLAGDAVPATFSFTDQTGVDLFAPVTSAPVTITGIDIASPITVTGGEYSIGCTSIFRSVAGNISSGQTVCVRHTSSFDSSASSNTTLTIGTVSDTFTSTTKVGDQLPADFSFTSQSNVALETLVTSNTITITDVDSPVEVVVSGPSGEFGLSVGCTGTFDGNVNGEVVDPGATLCIGVISADTDSTGVVATVTIGGSGSGSQKTATFTVTTGVTVPASFTFTDQVGVGLDATVYADPITITGITAPSKVEISQNGQYQINCAGPFTGSDGLVSDGDTLCVRHVAAGSLTSLTNTVLTVGGVSDTFTSTTTADNKLPGGSAMDGWSLLLLVPLLGHRRYGRAR